MIRLVTLFELVLVPFRRRISFITRSRSLGRGGEKVEEKKEILCAGSFEGGFANFDSFCRG